MEKICVVPEYHFEIIDEDTVSIGNQIFNDAVKKDEFRIRAYSDKNETQLIEKLEELGIDDYELITVQECIQRFPNDEGDI